MTLPPPSAVRTPRENPDYGEFSTKSPLSSLSVESQSNLKKRRLTPKGPRGRYGCRTCRQRHVKCDESQPKCDNCTRAKRDCIWAHDIRISHDSRSSVSNNTPSSTSATYNGLTDRGVHIHSATEQRDSSRSLTLRSVGGGVNPELLATIPKGTDGDYLASHTDSSIAPQDLLAFPLEACLFQLYIDHAGPWLDITSVARHFSSTIPRLALSNRVLIFACLAFAARAFLPQSSLSSQYSGTCVKLLIPLLSDEDFVETDETLLATLVLLRHVEQYAEAGEDQAAHLSGAYSLVALRRIPPLRESLPGTALWTYMRQDVRQALLNRAPPKMQPSRGIHLNNFSGDEGESSWADRACYLAALACTFAWGSAEGEVIDEGYLEAQLQWWENNVPPSYQAYHESEDSIRFLPTYHGL